MLPEQLAAANHEAGHGATSVHYGHRVKSLSVNQHSGGSAVHRPPDDIPPTQWYRENAVIARAGALAAGDDWTTTGAWRPTGSSCPMRVRPSCCL